MGLNSLNSRSEIWRRSPRTLVREACSFEIMKSYGFLMISRGVEVNGLNSLNSGSEIWRRSPRTLVREACSSLLSLVSV